MKKVINVEGMKNLSFEMGNNSLALMDLINQMVITIIFLNFQIFSIFYKKIGWYN